MQTGHLHSKYLAPLIERIKCFDSIIKKGSGRFYYDKGVHITLESCDTLATKEIERLARDLKSWRKGPFYIGDLFIDSEWRSFIKWDFLMDFIGVENAEVADIGCNNGFYMFAMMARESNAPKAVVGFEPVGLFYCQYMFINHFLNLPLTYQLSGIEQLGEYCTHNKKVFDIVFALGILYHRTDVFSALKSLRNALVKGGMLVLDSLVISSNEPIALCPPTSYAKMKNAYFIPSISAIMGWLERCGFYDIKLLGIIPTTTNEQRKSKWMDSLSLESFLDPNDPDKTIEGFEGPKRAYFIAKRK